MKRPNYFVDSCKGTIAVDADFGKKHKKTVNNSIEPAASKPVIEGKTGGTSEGASGVPAHNGSQSSSGDRFRSTAVGDERSLHHHLKPTVSELCKLLQFSEDVKMIVERFLEYVLENYNVSKEHMNALQALMISLCWIGSSLSIHKIDRERSFALAKEHLNFCCTEEEANSVFSKLESAKEKFLRDTDNQKKPDAVKDRISAPPVTCTEPIDPRMSHSVPLSPHGVKLKIAECQHNQNADVERNILEPAQAENHQLSYEETLQSTEKEPNKCKRQAKNLAGKNQQEIKKFNREWDERRVHLENDYKLDKALIRTLYHNPSVRSEKLKSLDKDFANKLEEHERMRDVHLKDLKATQLAADGQMAVNRNSSSSEGRANDELPLHGSQHENQIVFSGDSKKGAQETDPNEGNTFPDASDAVEDHNETDPNDMAVHVDSAGMGVPAAYCKNENTEDSSISPDTSHAVDDQNDSGGCSSRNSPSVAASDEITPSVQLFGSPVFDHSVPTNLEISDESHQLQQLPFSGIQDKEGQANTSSLAKSDVDNLQPVDAGQVGQISLEGSLLEPHDDPSFLLSTNSPIAVNQSDILPASGLLIETTCEEPALTCYSGERSRSAENYTNPSNHTMLQSRGNLEEHPPVAAETPLGEHRPHVPSSDTVQDQPSVELHNSTQNPETLPLTAEIPNQEASQPELNLFDIQGSENHNQVASQIPNQHPLQAELERLYELKDNCIKFHEDTKLKLKSEREKEIAEMMAQINLKYEAKCQDAEAAFHEKKNDLVINLNKVVMNKILAEAFSSQCQNLTPSWHAGMQQVTQAGLMQQLHWFSMLHSMRRPVGVTSTSSSQSSRSQQITLPPPPPPLQIVHQSAALLSSMLSRPPPNTNHRSPSNTPSGQPPSINHVTAHSMSSRPLADINPITSSSTPSRPPRSISLITPSSTPSILPPGINLIAPLSTPNRPTPSIHLITPSAGSLRVNSDTRAPAPHIQPFRPSGYVSPHHFASHSRLLPSQHIASSLPLTTPTNSQALALPPLSTSSLQPLAPPRREASSLPPPRPASARTPPSASSWLPSWSQLPCPPPPQASSQSPAPPSLLTHHYAPPSQQHIPSSLPITSSSFPHPLSRTPLPRIPSVPTGLKVEDHHCQLLIS